MAMKKVRNTKFGATVLVLVLIAAILGHVTFATLRSNSVIHTSGIIYEHGTGEDVYAVSGSANDIQAAVDSIAFSGGTVHVPAGTFYWNGETVTIPGGVNVIGASNAGCKGHEDSWENYASTTILINNLPQDDNVPSHYAMFQVNTFNPPNSNHKPVRISGIQFEATPPVNAAMEAAGGYSAITVNQINDFRIDHCTFINFCGITVYPNAMSGNDPTETCYGVVDHCVFSLPYKTVKSPSGGDWAWGYGVYAQGSGGYQLYTSSGWTYPVTSFFGKYGPVPGYTICYVEDCHFSYFRHCTDGIEGGYICSRFNLEDSPACVYWIGMSCVHGNVAGGWQQGGRGQEVYNNKFVALTATQIAAYPWLSPDNTAFQLRGGAGLCYNNNYAGNGYTGQLAAFITFSNGDDYPGMEYWDNGMDVRQTYIWDNTYTNCRFMFFDYRVEGYNWTQNIHYFLRAPNQAQDGFTYTPYPYPHPLTL